jgi:hypothetical protein
LWDSGENRQGDWTPRLGIPTMENIQEILRQKEVQLEQLQREVDALRLTAKLLSTHTPEAPSTSLSQSVNEPAVSAQNTASALPAVPAEPAAPAGDPVSMSPGLPKNEVRWEEASPAPIEANPESPLLRQFP